MIGAVNGLTSVTRFRSIESCAAAKLKAPPSELIRLPFTKTEYDGVYLLLQGLFSLAFAPLNVFCSMISLADGYDLSFSVRFRAAGPAAQHLLLPRREILLIETSP